MTVTTDYKFRVRAVDSQGHSYVPDGTVRVKASSGTYTIKDVNNNTVTVDADGYYHLTLDSSGYAVYTINFSAAGTGIKLQYDYTGSDTFAASALSESASFDVQAATP
jgi:hypothetical protein